MCFSTNINKKLTLLFHKVLLIWCFCQMVFITNIYANLLKNAVWYWLLNRHQMIKLCHWIKFNHFIYETTLLASYSIECVYGWGHIMTSMSLRYSHMSVIPFKQLFTLRNKKTTKLYITNHEWMESTSSNALSPQRTDNLEGVSMIKCHHLAQSSPTFHWFPSKGTGMQLFHVSALWA